MYLRVPQVPRAPDRHEINSIILTAFDLYCLGIHTGSVGAAAYKPYAVLCDKQLNFMMHGLFGAAHYCAVNILARSIARKGNYEK